MIQLLYMELENTSLNANGKSYIYLKTFFSSMIDYQPPDSNRKSSMAKQH